MCYFILATGLTEFCEKIFKISPGTARRGGCAEPTELLPTLLFVPN